LKYFEKASKVQDAKNFTRFLEVTSNRSAKNAVVVSLQASFKVFLT